MNISFGRAVWLAPIVYAIHFIEENNGFPFWVTEHFHVPFSQTQFYRNGIILMAALVGLCILLPHLPGKSVVLLLLTYLSGLIFHNTGFPKRLCSPPAELYNLNSVI